MPTFRSLIGRNKQAKDVPPVSAASSPPRKIFPTGLKVLHEPEFAVVDIVFIHGLTGDREKTWQAKRAVSPWPQILLPPKLPHARVLTFGYDANVVDWRAIVSKNRIGDHAGNLLAALATFRENSDTNHRPILFVAHSMGGLVCEDALLASRNSADEHLQNILTYTRGILFLGTPHAGSGYARWAELMAKSIGLIKQTNHQILDVLKNDSEVLARIQTDFHTMARARAKNSDQPIGIICFYEELPLPGIGKEVVPKHSAILPAYSSIGIHSNHIDMTKFEVEDDPGFISVVGELLRWTKDLKLTPEGLPSRNIKVHFLVPYSRDLRFVGRNDAIDIIESRFQNFRRVALAGIGGVGKSQIAIEYCYKFQEAHPDGSVFWVHSATTERFTQAYRDIARDLTLPGWDDPKSNILQLVFMWLSDQNHEKWLMILDNVDDSETFFPKSNFEEPRPASLASYLPQCSNGSIIVTTRDTRVGERLTESESIMVLPFDDQAALLLLQSRLFKNEVLVENDDVMELLEMLGHLPLAITQAAAFITENKISVTEYIDMLRADDTELALLLDQDIPDLRRDEEASSSVLQTWKLSFDQIQKQQPRAAQILSMMAVLDRQGIPKSLLRKENERASEFIIAMGTLKAFSLITTESGGEIFALHRLVQLFTTSWLEYQNERGRFQGEALQLLSTEFPIGVYDNRETCELLLPHARKVLDHKCTANTSLLCRATLLYNLAWFEEEHGHYERAFQNSEESYVKRRDLLLKDRPETLASAYLLARVLRNLGKYAEAEEMSQQTLELEEKVLGKEHPATLTTMGNLALVLRDQGKYAEAEEMHQQTLSLREKVLGKEHPATLATMNNLASVLLYQGKYAEAEKMYQQTLNLREKVLGNEHPNTPVTMSNLASVLRDQGKYAEAAKMNQQTLKLSEKVLGKEHPNTLSTLNNLALVLQNQGKYAEAEKMYQQTLNLKEKVLGKEHPDTLVTMSNLALVLSDQGQYAEAEEMNQQTLKLSEKVLGKEHPDTLSTLNNLALVLLYQGKYAEAAKMNQQTLKLEEKVLGKEHPDTLVTMNNLASVLRDQGKYAEAEEMNQQTLILREKVLGKEHPNTLVTMSNLASVLRDQGKYAEAEKMYQQTLNLKEKVLGKEHPDTLVTMSNIASVLRDQGKYAEAEEMNQQTLKLQEKVLGNEHPNTLVTMSNLASVLRDQGKYAEAKELQVQVLKTEKRVLGDEHPKTLISMHNLAYTYHDLDQKSSAI